MRSRKSSQPGAPIPEEDLVETTCCHEDLVMVQHSPCLLNIPAALLWSVDEKEARRCQTPEDTWSTAIATAARRDDSAFTHRSEHKTKKGHYKE